MHGVNCSRRTFSAVVQERMQVRKRAKRVAVLLLLGEGWVDPCGDLVPSGGGRGVDRYGTGV